MKSFCSIILDTTSLSDPSFRMASWASAIQFLLFSSLLARPGPAWLSSMSQSASSNGNSSNNNNNNNKSNYIIQASELFGVTRKVPARKVLMRKVLKSPSNFRPTVGKSFFRKFLLYKSPILENLLQISPPNLRLILIELRLKLRRIRRIKNICLWTSLLQ